MKICKWKYNADSPVMFMIDDLCNSWVDSNGNGKIDLGEDFGAGMFHENSSFKFLEEEILKKYPKIKVNFYVPVGKRIGMLLNSKIKMYSAPINENEEIKKFFKNIHNNPKYELSFHGVTHGQAFEDPKNQKQEWECYNSLEEALKTIENGKEIFKDVTGEYPKGGKYCGYIGSTFGDKSIDKSEFLWWHRFWNRGIERGYTEDFCGKETNPLKAYDITEFGKSNVIDIPSTIDGSLFNTESNSIIKKIIKLILNPCISYRKQLKLDFLLKNKLVISIQEHICSARDDGKRQTPNIFDDKKSLLKIFKYLKTKNVWYCTGTELAEYYYLRKNIKIIENGDEFYFDLKKITKEIENMEITLFFNKKYSKIVLPNTKEIKIKNDIVTIDVMEGKYSLEK